MRRYLASGNDIVEKTFNSTHNSKDISKILEAISCKEIKKKSTLIAIT